MATHSSILARIIPWTEETGGLQSMGSQRVSFVHEEQHRRVLKGESIYLFKSGCITSLQIIIIKMKTITESPTQGI